jgi:multiple sugar transport system ATP-binding protein
VADIWLKSVNKVYAGGVQAVHDVDLKIGRGEFMVLVGPSGCGKTTLLRMIAGLEEVTEGEIWIGDRDVTQLTPRERDIAMVFQNYALYPHMSVEQNLGYGLKVRKTDSREVKDRVNEVAKLLGLEELLDRRPVALSGGQRQRVAMGRAIVREPVAFLMDEPLSNLDAKLRVGMRAELVRLHERLGTTTVYVTHDQTEAMTLGQRVAVMRDGYLQQVDTPQRLYRHPANVFVAAFIGSPSMNLTEARIADGHAEFGAFRIPLTGDHPTGTVILGFRPHALEDAARADPSLPTIEVEPAVIEELGSATHVIFPVDAAPVDVEATSRTTTAEGDQPLLLATDRRALFTAETTAASKAQVGVKLKLAIDPSRFHFFDPETGSALDSSRRGQVATSAARSSS